MIVVRSNGNNAHLISNTSANIKNKCLQNEHLIDIYLQKHLKANTEINRKGVAGKKWLADFKMHKIPVRLVIYESNRDRTGGILKVMIAGAKMIRAEPIR